MPLSSSVRLRRTVRFSVTFLFAALLLGGISGEALLRWRDPAGTWRLFDPSADPIELTFTTAKIAQLPDGTRADAAKRKGTFRIVCVGGSVAAGYPVPGRGFPERLGARLRAAFPTRRIEVWNLGRPSFGSERDAALLENVLRDADPDLLVVEEGNNEAFEGQLSAVLARRPFARATRVLRALAARTALGTKILRLSRPAPALEEFEPLWAKRRVSSGPLAVAGADDFPSAALSGDRLRRALSRIAAAAGARNVPVLVVVPANDERRFLPIVVNWPEPDASAAARQAAAALLSADLELDSGRSGGCESTLARAMAVPMRLYLLGRCEDFLRRPGRAAAAYTAWHDQQITATRVLKDALRQQARALRLPIADLDADFRREGPRGAALFVDDHHMTSEGYAWAGDRIALAAQKVGLFSPLGAARPGSLSATMPLPAASAVDQAKTAVLIAHQLGAWSTSTDSVIGGSARFARRSVELYTEALRLYPGIVDFAARPQSEPTARGLLALAAWRRGDRAGASRIFASAAASGAQYPCWHEAAAQLRRDPSFPLAAALAYGGGTRALFGATRLQDRLWMLDKSGAFFIAARTDSSRIALRSALPRKEAGPMNIRVYWNGRLMKILELIRHRPIMLDVPAQAGVLSIESNRGRVPLLAGVDVDPLPESVFVELKP